MQTAIAVFLLLLGAAILVAGYRAYRQMMQRAGEFSESTPRIDVAEIEGTGDVGPDGLVYLFAHEFVQPKSAGPMTLDRDKAYAPMTQDELDPEDWAVQLLYVAVTDLHDAAAVECRIVERQATFMPPFPHKRWELEVIQRTPFEASPVMSALEVAFELMRSRKQQRVAQGKEEPGELWCPLDEIIERALKAMRQEIGFWERSGVYGDLRNYVASALIAQGYVIQPDRETWLDRARSRRPRPNVPAIEKVKPDAEELAKRLARFKATHGSPFARGEAEPAEGQQQLVREADPSLATRESEFEEMPFDDCLRISIYETLVSLKQLEPSSGSGV